MKMVFRLWAMTLLGLILAVTVAMASSIDTHIKNLKSEDPEVRATAAYELGCS